MTTTPAGETIRAEERRTVVILLAGPALTLTWSRYAAGEPGPDLHVHREHTDSFYVLEGELTFLVGPDAERIRVGAGGMVSVPPNVIHTYVCDGPGEACWLNMHSPDAGFADYMRGLRDRSGVAYDQWDPPADGGRPASDAVVVHAR